MSELSKKLAMLSAASPNSDGLDNPFDDVDKSPADSLPPGRDIFALSPEEKKKKLSRTDDLLRRHEYFSSFTDDEIADEIDGYFDDFDDDDENLRDSLISMGRKYARETAVSPGSSEISKLYSSTEKQLKSMVSSLSDDMTAIQKDIDRIRMSRTSRYSKTFSDMISAKKGLYDSQLSAIRELNRTREKQYEYQRKELEKKQMEDSGNSSLSTNAIRDLFSLGRGDIVSSAGGYSSISGATTEDDEGNPIYESYEEDREISDNPEEESEGEKFIKYEGMGVEYVLLVNEDGTTQSVIAEDRDGNYIPDYPLPTNIEELTFDIDKKSGRATDDYHRSYKVRYV